jgi:hypothetical protein
MVQSDLIGIGLYTPAEAGRLIHVSSAKISRWLKGHQIGGRFYPALWKSEVSLGDEKVYLGFRDLMEARVANAFIEAGVSAIKVRDVIDLAKDVMGRDHPLSTNQFRTDGREIFLQLAQDGSEDHEQQGLLNLCRRQYEFKGFLDPILKSVDFGDDGNPLVWWPGGRRLNILVDTARSFGQPIDSLSSVPTAVLAAAARMHGNVRDAARDYDVGETSVRHALEFETSMEQRLAA